MDNEFVSPDGMENAREKSEMIDALCNSLRDALKDSIHKMPCDWNGFEIRQLGSDLLRERLVIPMDARRMRRYRREKLNRNL